MKTKYYTLINHPSRKGWYSNNQVEKAIRVCQEKVNGEIPIVLQVCRDLEFWGDSTMYFPGLTEETVQKVMHYLTNSFSVSSLLHAPKLPIVRKWNKNHSLNYEQWKKYKEEAPKRKLQKEFGKENGSVIYDL